MLLLHQPLGHHVSWLPRRLHVVQLNFTCGHHAPRPMPFHPHVLREAMQHRILSKSNGTLAVIVEWANVTKGLALELLLKLPPFYMLVYVDDLVFATVDTKALALVKAELQKIYSCADLGELRSYLGLQITRDRARRTITLTQSHMVHQVLQRFGLQFSSPPSTPLPNGHSLSAPPSDESVEPSGQYPELVGCLICEAEIYAGAMAAQELRWLTYLLTDLGERPRSPPVLYVDYKATIALCREQRLEHRKKHIALRYFFARESQQRGQLRFAYVASWPNTADIFTKAPGSGDHQRFCTTLGLVPTMPHLLAAWLFLVL
ncbi:unnamed protein product [Closterium sp. NIES-54]